MKLLKSNRLIVDIISRSRNLEMSIAETVNKHYKKYAYCIKTIEKLKDAFTKHKKEHNLLDFDDLMEVLRDKLEQNEEFRQTIQEQTEYVLVDEYQDVNNAQRRIVELIVGQRSGVTVVGDDAQSIYSFRGANYENILSFSDSFNDYECIKLECNYRSSPGILKGG